MQCLMSIADEPEFPSQTVIIFACESLLTISYISRVIYLALLILEFIAGASLVGQKV